MIPGFDLSKIDPKLQLLDLDRTECEESLYHFLKCAWQHIDPSPWKDGWAVDAIAEHLQAVCDGQIKRLIVNVPPRCSKSSLISIAFPAWVWAQQKLSATSGPGVQFMYASYADKLSLRHSVSCRNLIESEWYKKRWGDRFELTSDQNTKSAFTNSKGGERLITSVGAGITGLGGSIILADDPNSAGEAFSEAAIQSTIDWWSQSMSTRLNDMATGAYVIIQQRLAEDDLTGYILEKNNGEWCHLMLPMRYEPERSYVTTIGWKDPRTVPGELLWPERFSEQAVVELERSLGPMIANGQLQQRPEPAGGGIIPRDYWKLWERDTFPQMDFIMASLDTAYTEKTSNDFSALTVWGVFSGERSLIDTPNRVIDKRGESQMMYRDNAMYEASTAPKVMMMFAWKERFELHKLVEKVADTCTKLKVDLLLIESKAAGHSVAQEVRRLYANERFGVQLFDPKSQDKLSRLFSIQHLFAEGIVYAPDRKWADMVITEVAQFPYSKFDDLTDTVSQALRHMRDNGLIARAPERAAELEELKRYRGRQEPLYPV
jgi:predicted phage terminase large subunit-like protein